MVGRYGTRMTRITADFLESEVTERSYRVRKRTERRGGIHRRAFLLECILAVADEVQKRLNP
jgi:hypothetical protein